MKKTLVTLGIPSLVALAGILAIAQWMRQAAVFPIEEPRLPIEHRPLIVSPAPGTAAAPTPAAPTSQSPTPAAPVAAQTTQAADATVEAIPGSWPAFRGPDYDGISKDPTKLNRDWAKTPPKELWAVDDLGEGYAVPAVADGRVFLVDYDQVGKRDNVRCFALANGKQLWNYAYPVEVKRNHGMSRTMPAVYSNRVVTLGPMCHVHAFEATTGKHLWEIDLVKDYKTVVPEWYAGQCPIIEDGKAILAPGGADVLMMAVNVDDGKVVWTTPNPKGFAMSHASILPHTFKGRRMFIYASRGGITGVDAADGKVLWEFTEWAKIIADVPTPVAMGEDKLFVARAYEQGSLIIQLKEENGTFRAELVKKMPRRIFGSDQHTPIFYKNHLYGARPPRGELVCLDTDGNPLWTSPQTARFGIGGYSMADGLLYIMDDSCTMSVVEVMPESYKEVSRRKLLEGRETWGPITIAGGRMLVRDSRTDKPNSSRMVCLDIAAK